MKLSYPIRLTNPDDDDPAATAYEATLPYYDPHYAGIMVADLRHSQHMTQEQLARKVNIPLNTLSAYERGKRNLPLERLAKIADALGMPVQHFYRVPVEP